MTTVKRFEAYTDSGKRHFVYDNKLQCQCGRYKTLAIARQTAKVMNEEFK